MDQHWFKKKKRNRPYFQLPNYKFKNIVVCKPFFVILYSILHCQVHHGLTDKKKSGWKRLLRILCLGGRKIVYDLSNLVYNDTIQNSCIPKLLLFTSILFDILGYVLSQNF